MALWRLLLPVIILLRSSEAQHTFLPAFFTLTRGRKKKRVAKGRLAFGLCDPSVEIPGGFMAFRVTWASALGSIRFLLLTL